MIFLLTEDIRIFTCMYFLKIYIYLLDNKLFVFEFKGLFAFLRVCVNKSLFFYKYIVLIICGVKESNLR